MDKRDIVATLRTRLRVQYERALAAVEGAREGATGDDARAENKYDTRGLESSYLAAGQADLADELAEAVARLEGTEFPDYEIDDPIGPGALVEVDREGTSAWFLLAPAGGGIIIETDEGESVTVLGPSAPLRALLLGRTSGESVGDSDLVVLEVF